MVIRQRRITGGINKDKPALARGGGRENKKICKSAGANRMNRSHVAATRIKMDSSWEKGVKGYRKR